VPTRGHFAAWLEGKLLSSADGSFGKLTEEQIEHEIACTAGWRWCWTHAWLARPAIGRADGPRRGHDWKWWA